jgi:hypothetical protein
MRKSDLRHKNARLRQKINSVLEQHSELRDVTDEIALKQGTRVRVGTPFLERIQAKLQERARAIIESRPDLEHHFVCAVSAFETSRGFHVGRISGSS